jgi:hypothetical protein
LSIYDELAEMGFGLKQLKILWYMVSEISNANDISKEIAVAKFLKDIQEHYDDRLGFQVKVENLEFEIQKLTQQLKIQRTQLSLYPTVGPVILSLFQNGVNEVDIMAFAELIKSQSTSVTNTSSVDGRSLLDDMRRYGDIKFTLNRISKQLYDLRKELGSLEAHKQQLQSDNEHLTIRLADLNKVGHFFNGYINATITEIARLFSTFAALNVCLLQIQSEMDRALQRSYNVEQLIPLTQIVRGEPVELSDLKKAVSKATKILLMRMSENDSKIRNSLSSALVLLENEANSTN